MNKNERVQTCFALLIAQAKLGKITTYGAIAPQLGVPAVGVSPYLNIILEHCRSIEAPPLPIIVVNQRTRKPGGPYNSRTIGPDTVRVFAFDWLSVEPLPISS